ncbi:hypothetical protein CEV34_1288 [Brucella pseudogrignonensis]|uniref:Uncharacterized protein n=1 Tax=Brucella pseudogrignonensis TaxID=419475 RepID=A0A256GM64_9HYPH|nr:hypothetical protein CEV34_1288 [Brucella pseudogrignonensis]
MGTAEQMMIVRVGNALRFVTSTKYLIERGFFNGACWY